MEYAFMFYKKQGACLSFVDNSYNWSFEIFILIHGITEYYL